MLFLTSTSDKIQVVTSAAGQVDVHASFSDYNGTAVSIGRTNTRITTAATTDVVASPGASTSRAIKNIKVANTHASVTNTVSILHTDGATAIEIEKVTLLPGERMGYEEGTGVRVFDTGGREKITNALTLPTGNANTADVTANAADTYLGGGSLAIGGRVQAGSFFKWRMRATKTAAGIAGPVFNVRVGTAGTTADTARATVTGGAQTAATDTGMFEMDAIFRAVGATAVIQMTLRYDHLNATTGFASTQFQMLANTGASFDVTNLSNIIGVSVNPGASGVWTFQEVTIEANNLLS